MELEKVLKKRRAVNFFDSSVEIIPEQLKAIYDLAKLAPTSFNFQPYRIIAAVSKEAKDALMQVGFKQPKIRDASATLVIVGDMTMYDHADAVYDDMLKKGYARNKEGLQQVKDMAAGLYAGDRGPAFASRNAGLFAMALILAAENMGFDTHPMDGFDIEGVKKLYNLKANELPVMLIAVGRFDSTKTLLPPKMRREFDKVVDIK